MRSLLKIFQLFRKLYWFLVKPTTIGVRGLLLNDDKSQVFLVKHSYDIDLHLPGGKVRKSENIVEGLKRELLEEAGIEVESLRIIGIYDSQKEFKNDHIIVFLIEKFQFSSLKKRSIEIESALFYDINVLPKEVSPATRKCIALDTEVVNFGKW